MAAPSDDLTRLLAAARHWLGEGHALALATVAATWGSSPRPVGSHLLVRDDGAFEGSVSGGCVEGDVIAEAAAAIADGRGRRLAFGVADETAWRAGLGCGGRLDVLVQPVSAAGFPPELFAVVADARARGRPVTVAFDPDGHAPRQARRGGQAGALDVRYDPPARLVLVGAVQIAQALAPMARLAGYAPTIVDPRTAFAGGGRFAGETVLTDWPDEAMAALAPDAATAVVALAHDPKIDDPALIAALASEAHYVAALGSRANAARRGERLRAAGVAEANLARLRGPAGLPIGARTPAEIAVSILAEMIAARHGTRLPAWPSRPA